MNNPLTPEQQVRFQLAASGKYPDTAALETVFQWVMGSKQTIIPVNKFEVVKQ